MRWFAGLILLVLCGVALHADAPPAHPDATHPSQVQRSHFKFLDIYLDAGDAPLAAWQFELLMNERAASVVGIEGGEHPAYNAAPHHDLLELIHHRVIIAAFSTSPNLPHGKTRIARIHVEVHDGVEPHFQTKLVVAATPDGKSFPAHMSIVEGEAK